MYQGRGEKDGDDEERESKRKEEERERGWEKRLHSKNEQRASLWTVLEGGREVGVVEGGWRK